VFIELTEHLKCPAPHEVRHLILVPDRMERRMVMEGTVGCPVCRREYPVREGIVRFGPAARPSPSAPVDASRADAVRALLGLSNPGGYAVLVGSACTLAAPLGALMGGVHLIGINPPAAVESTLPVSLLEHDAALPLRDAMARGVVLGGEFADSPWVAEAARVLLAGQRLVALCPEITPPGGVTKLAAGLGMWAGEKTPRRGAT
jgi:uncharacterized protein YbaR (Trm112 family)